MQCELRKVVSGKVTSLYNIPIWIQVYLPRHERVPRTIHGVDIRRGWGAS
jgi:hypothetical protein